MFAELDECENVSVRAHSISKSIMLKKICDDYGNVVELTHDTTRDARGNITGDIEFVPKKTSISRASVFHGLCEEHEKKFFLH